MRAIRGPSFRTRVLVEDVEAGLRENGLVDILRSRRGEI